MIDDKGRIFGKLNIIDLLVILLVLLVGIFLVFKLIGRDSGGGAAGSQITYTVKVEGVEPACYEAIKDSLPAQLMASGEMLEGNVVEIQSAPHDKIASINTTTGVLSLPVDQDLLDLTFTITATVSNSVTQEVGTQEVRIGKSHIVKTATFEFERGVILSCEKVAAE
jgi:hypothetical protein